MIGEFEPGAPVRCSRAGCMADASWIVNWRNPRIHGPERVKHWPACDEHREWLREWLAARSFPVVVTDVTDPLTRLPEDLS